MDITTATLIAELHRQGVLDSHAIDNIANRLERAGEDAEADRIRMLVVANALDDPENRRSGIHLVSNGGNEAE